MTNRELHDALKAELSIPYEELIIKHPTIADLGTEFVDYTEDGVFTLKYPLKDTQRNGYHLLQGGYISSFFDNNYYSVFVVTIKIWFRRLVLHF